MTYKKWGVKEYGGADPATKESKRFNRAKGKYAGPVHETGKVTPLFLRHTFKF
jgi:hypothetical protein